MALVLKSNRVATASLGNVNGIKGSQNWAVFLDFENEIYQTKKNGEISQNYLLQDVVEASRANLNGSPISISKNGVERKITSTTEIRTALLRNGRFGLLSEDLNENFFKNSANPVTQTIVLPASKVPIAVSCYGNGSVVVSGDVVESGQRVTENTPTAFTRSDTTKETSITVAVSGALSHVQVELATGAMTASSKVTTLAQNATRVREKVILKPKFFTDHVVNKGNFTVVVQTIDFNSVINPQKSGSLNRLGVVSSNVKALCTTGNSANGSRYQQPRVYLNEQSFDPSTAVFLDEIDNSFYAFTSAISVSSTKLKMATGGVRDLSEANLPTEFTVEALEFGGGYSSPIAVNGLRGIITKLVIYDWVLTDAELIEVSKSWG